MPDRPCLSLDLVVEDVAHEGFFTALSRQIASNLGVDLVVRPRSTRGGRPAVMQELSAISSAIKAPFGVTDLPDILLVAIDTDCHGGKQTKDDVSGAIGHFPGLVVATPDPEVERWLMLDREAFAAVVGTDPGSVEHTCDEGHFKKQLADALVEAGALSLLGGFEYADEIAETMNLFRSGKIDGCFRIFCSDLRAAIRHLM